MSYSNDQVLENMIKSWTRIDMLLELYERTIAAVRMAQKAQAADDKAQMQLQVYESHKLILAIHSGLKVDESEIAHNVARLLGFIVLRIDEGNFEEAVQFLEKLHSGYADIREEAATLEANGEISPLQEANVFEAVA